MIAVQDNIHADNIKSERTRNKNELKYSISEILD